MTSSSVRAMGTRQHTGQSRRTTSHLDPSAQIHAPFDRLDEEEVNSRVDEFIRETGLSLYRQYILKGAFIAQNDRAFDSPRDDNLSLTDEESTSLQQEETKRWKHPRSLWQLVILCAVGAATQGWDESAIDGGKTSQYMAVVFEGSLTCRMSMKE